MNACRLNNDHFLKEMHPASSRATVLGILTADITDLPSPPLPYAPLKSCQGGAKIKVTPADAGKVSHIRPIRAAPSQTLPQCQLAGRPRGRPAACLAGGAQGRQTTREKKGSTL